MTAKNRLRFRGGFTLVEMTVVLLIIAIVTHLAMQQLGHIRDRKLVAAANRQLENVRDAVFRYDRDGTPAGFLADVGRLPVATNGTLAELWQRPVGIRPYAVLPATKKNLAKDAPGGLENAGILVATGWRGPYLRLPVGKRRLTDPWGNPIENPDAAGYDRIGTNNTFAVALSHFGPTALSRDEQRQRLPLTPDGGARSQLFVRLVSRSEVSSGLVTYKWYGPKDGLITGGVTNAVYGATAELRGLSPGMRIVRAEWDATKGTSRLINVRPGDNQVEIEVP